MCGDAADHLWYSSSMGLISHRSLVVLVSLMAALAGCRTTQRDAGTDGQTTAATPERPAPRATWAAEADDEASARPAPDTSAAATGAAMPSPVVELLLVLENPVMSARSDPSVDVAARLDGTLHLRNPSSEPIELVGRVPAGSELEWTILGTDGVRWRPVFLPPAPQVPRPPAAWKVGPGATERFCNVHGIVGFSRPGDDKRYRVLPVGKCTVRVGGMRFQGMPPLQSSLAEFQVK
jgi:hypothetical protein